jgi:hypothetical protein
MQLAEVRKRAEALGLKPGTTGKVDLIHAIQKKEGNSPCFQTGLDSCDQSDCCWRSDCLPGSSTENKRAVYLRKIKAELKGFNDKIDTLKARAKSMAGKRKTEALEDIKRLEKKFEDEIKLKIQDLTGVSEEMWQSTKKGIEASWKELKKASQETLSRFGSPKPKDRNPSL